MRYFLIILILSLSACKADETISGQTSDQTWLLQTMNKAKIDTTVTISFPEKGKVTGRAPCNRYFASQTAPLPWFEVGPIGATKMACPKLALETEYFRTLEQVNLAEVVKDTLILSKDQQTLLTFKRQ